jgi:hypothetical protein
MQLQIHAQHDLRDQHEHQPIRERGMEVLVELASFMGVTEEVG